MSRLITTAEELRSLPRGSILMSKDNHYPRYALAVWRVADGMVTRVGRELEGVTPVRYFVDPLPVLVIHEPEPTI